MPPSTARRSHPPRLLPLAAVLSLALALPAHAAEKKSPAHWDGLERRQSKVLDHLYVRPGVVFTAYKRVKLAPVQVEFDKNWDPNSGKKGVSGRVTSADIQQIRTDLAAVFRDIIIDTLEQGGYAIAEEDADDVLQVTPGLVNVYVTAPGRAASSTSYTFSESAGRMTLFMELRDSVTGQILARAVDTAVDSSPRGAQWVGSVANSAAAKEILSDWAGQLRKALDQVNGKAPPPSK